MRPAGSTSCTRRAPAESTAAWSRLDPHPLIVNWARARGLTGHGRRAAVVGCGLGADAEYLAALHFDTTGFDVSATAILLAEQRVGGAVSVARKVSRRTRL
jgi:2-polyprenyl-3-methyl-5-hydroxy-6-metoxy-1,4-benzoquinol methylase